MDSAHGEQAASERQILEQKQEMLDKEADDLLHRRRCNELLVWWKARALEAGQARQRAQQAGSDTTVADAVAVADELLARADKTLLQARKGHAGKVAKVQQAQRHLTDARRKLKDAGTVLRDEAVQRMQQRADEELKWAQLVEQAHSAKARAEHALTCGEWEKVLTQSDEAAVSGRAR